MVLEITNIKTFNRIFGSHLGRVPSIIYANNCSPLRGYTTPNLALIDKLALEKTFENG